MAAEFQSDAYLEKRPGDPCRICGGATFEYRDRKRRAGIGAARWSRWCVGCDYAAKACKCPPRKVG